MSMPTIPEGKIITSVWSSYGHTFMSAGDVEEWDGATVGYYVSCLTCGAHYVERPTADGGWDEEDVYGIRGEFVNVRGDEASECTGDTSMAHGYPGERVCDEEECEHCAHDCACLLCDS